tara:strand:+ start:8915 stop:9682 length:768 start_codon:yes stop_codon:yes gene_type:complete
MKNTAFNIAALAMITLFSSCQDKIKKTTTNVAVAETVKEVVPQKGTRHLYVTAASGLSLREYNNLNSEKLAVMPYGTKVEVVLAEKNNTMNIRGVSGGMHQVAYNNKTGYAFSGYLSELFPPEPGANAKMYIADLQNTHPTASITALVGGTASEPSNTQTLLIPTIKWHEAYLIAQKLYEIPRSFALPEPKGEDQEVINNPNKLASTLLSELQVSRVEDTLLKIVFTFVSQDFKRTVSITQQDNMMKIEEARIVY